MGTCRIVTSLAERTVDINPKVGALAVMSVADKHGSVRIDRIQLSVGNIDSHGLSAGCSTHQSDCVQFSGSISGTRLEVKLVLAKFSPNALFQAF